MSIRVGFRSKTGHSRGRYSKTGRKQLYFKKKNTQNIEDEITNLTEKYSKIESSKIKHFEDFPLSRKTQKGLKSSKYSAPTDIQRESIGLALQGQDILGAAKTGSGKTLAFIVPVLECLFKNKWSQLDGLGALIISPTRELAYQTFEVLRKVGKFHDFSAGLVIGGKPLMEEAGRINRTNIVICTPGRLLQHMDETSYFTADSLKILVLDEADRILDMGFAQTMNGIIENLPSERQTLLFSATQTRSVKDLARLSLTEPVFVSVHEHATVSTPVQLQQSYVVCELHEKLNLLWSFLKNHQKSKILVFLASCKEVKYIYEAFKKLQPGIPVLALHGGMPQLKRVAAYNQFIWKQNAVLFATDIAARGLDFPSINWVLQLDCPEDASTYIHRVGRTARYEKDGEALLVLTPSEEDGMVEQLKTRKIPINKIQINQKRFLSIQGKLESNCAAHPELKETAQKAFVSYLRSVFLMGNKKVFSVQSVDMEQFSRSLGLALPPKVRFLKKHLREMELKAEKVKAEQLKKAERTTTSQPPPEDDVDNTEMDNAMSKSSKKDKLGNKSKDVGSAKQKLAKFDKDIKMLQGSGESDVPSSDEENTSGDSDSDEIVDRSHITNLESDSGDSETAIGTDSEAESESESSLDESDLDKNKNCSKHANTHKTEMLMGKNSQKSERRVKENDIKTDIHKTKSISNKTDMKSELKGRETNNLGDESESEEDYSESSKIKGRVSQEGFNFDVADDQELFSVKRNVDLKEYDQVIQEPETNNSNQKNKKAKALTKYAVAKKLHRKKLQVNTKVAFDEEGEAVIGRLKAPAVEMDTERNDKAGGIDIERAKQRMRQEDTVDREIYRQKIKQKHREQRLKRKEENRQKNKKDFEGEEEAILDTAVGDDDDTDPLAFLPDPDEVYGKSQDSDQESESEWSPPPKKKQKTALKKMKEHKVRKTKYIDSSSHTDSTLADDEDLALRLLNK